MAISNLVTKYGLESEQELAVAVGEDHGDVEVSEGTADLVDVENDVKQMNDEGVTAALDNSTHDIEGDVETLEQTENAIVAVESYLQLLENRSSRNLALTDDVARVMRIGLESISPGLFAGMVVSMEDVIEGELVDDDIGDVKEFKERRSNMPALSTDKATATTKSGLGKVLQQLMEAAKKIFWRIVNGIGDFYNNLATNTTKLKERIKALIKESTALEGGKPFEVRGLDKLSIKGKFVGDEVAAYASISDTMNIVLGKLPVSGLEIIKQWGDKSQLNMFNISGRREEVDTLSDETIKAIFGFSKTVFSSLTPVSGSEDVPTGFSEEIKGAVYRSDVLMGNRAYYGGATSKSQIDNYRFLTTDFTLVPGLDSATLEKTNISTMTSSEAIAVLKKAMSLLENVDGFKNQRTAFDKGVKAIVKTEFDRLLGDSNDSTKIVYARIAVINFASALTKRNWQFTGYIIAIVKTLTALVESMLDAEKANDVKGETA